MKKIFVYLCLFAGLLQDYVSAYRLQSYTACPNLLVKNGKVKRRQRGRFVKIVCNTPYLLVGERYSTCIQGKWDPLPPKCVRPTCMNKVHPPTNGLIYPTHSGAALHFFCKAGFQLRGVSDVYCDGWKWDNNAPTCILANSKPKLFCDFENEDICGWTHDLNHDFDWRRENYDTPSGSIGTGPSFDHTKGQGQDGYYMYIESSSRNENDTARLISPIFDKTDTETCLEFFYHMFGATTGTLRVFLKKSSEDWSLLHSQLVFSKHGNQGDVWYRSYHSLGTIDEDYQIVIEGIRGPGYVSDIAVDDVKIIENCVFEDDYLSTTTELVYSTEALLTVESCENRCGLKAFSNETHQIPCDCDDNCYFNSTCCPNYLDFCVSGSTTDDYYTTTDMTNEVNQPNTTLVTAENGSTSKQPIPTGPLVTTARQITSKVTTSMPTTTTKATTTKSRTTPRPRPSTTRPFKPTVQVLQPPTTVAIVRKVLTTTAPTYARPVQPVKEESNDVMDVPNETGNNDKQEVVTMPFSDEEVFKERSSQEVDDRIVRGNSVSNFSESDKLFSKIKPENGNHSVVFIVISLVGVAVLTIVIAVFLVKRYRFSRRRLNGAIGDSQSDVRFLTNDEILDFSLDRDDCEL